MMDSPPSHFEVQWVLINTCNMYEEISIERKKSHCWPVCISEPWAIYKWQLWSLVKFVISCDSYYKWEGGACILDLNKKEPDEVHIVCFYVCETQEWTKFVWIRVKMFCLLGRRHERIFLGNENVQHLHRSGGYLDI